MFKFSVIFPAMFLLSQFFLANHGAWAWNPDYGYGLPKTRRMCAERDSPHTVHFYAIPREADCPKGATRYIVVFGRKPRDSLAMIRSTTSHKFYPPLTLSWPSDEKRRRNPLWHFTCVQAKEKEILGAKVSLFKYRGEITSEGKNDCLEAERRALKYCKDELKGEELLESCPVQWGL